MKILWMLIIDVYAWILSLSFSLSLSLSLSLFSLSLPPLVILMSMAQFAPRRIIESPFPPFPEGSYCLLATGDVIINGYIPASPPYTPSSTHEQVHTHKPYIHIVFLWYVLLNSPFAS